MHVSRYLDSAVREVLPKKMVFVAGPRQVGKTTFALGLLGRENLVASQLLKYCHWVEDTQGHVMELRYLRDTDKREVDFVVLRDRKPLFAVECKSGEKAVGAALRYFAERTPIRQFYQVHRGERHYSTGPIRVLPFARLCEELELP